MPTWFDNSWTFTTTDIVEWERDLTTGNYNLKTGTDKEVGSMKIIKAIAFVLSMGWSILLTAFAYRASVTELLILFTGLTGIALIFAIAEERSKE